MTEAAIAEEKKEEVGQFIGGEVRIIADAKTGNIHVQTSNSNLIVAFGLLEIAKCILVDRQRDARNDEPKIVKPGPADLKMAERKPS